jgi:hypothetical protein
LIDVKGTCEMFKIGLKGIEGLDRTIQSSLGHVEICDTSTYDTIDLPNFEFVASTSTSLR